jgi:glyoxylase-like metal-dependent hydrolase (beta-lactamase superfamily II)
MAMRLYACHAGGDRMDLAVFDPFDPEAGTKVYNPYFIYVVQHPDGIVVFDTGAHPDLAHDPAAKLGDAAATFELELAPGDDAASQLSSLGLDANDVEHVVQSHLHFDHAGGLCYFPNATVYAQEAELDFAMSPPVYQRTIYLPSDFDMVTGWHLLTGEHDVFGDGRVLIIPTPGHTAGHQSLLVQLEREVVFLIADATYRLVKMRNRLLPAVLWSPDEMVRSWERIEAIEKETGATLLCSHDLDFRERVRLAPDAWYE